MYIHEAVKQAIEKKCYFANKANKIDGAYDVYFEPTENSADCVIVHYLRGGGKKEYDVLLWNPDASDLMSDQWELFALRKAAL